MKNKLRHALLERQATLGSWFKSGHPACAEVLAARASTGSVWTSSTAPLTWKPQRTSSARSAGSTVCPSPASRSTTDLDSPHARRRRARPDHPYGQDRRRSRGGGARSQVSTARRAGVRLLARKPLRRDFESYIASANDEIAMIMQIEHKDALPTSTPSCASRAWTASSSARWTSAARWASRAV